MHILHLIKTSEGAKWACDLMKSVKQNYPDVSFSVVLPDNGRYFKEYQSFCRNVYLLDYKIGLSLFSDGRKLRQIVTQDSPDLIHSWFVQTTLYSRLFLRNLNVPKLFQVVGPLHLENPILKYIDIFSANRNDYWVATSRYIYNKYLESGVDKQRIFLNYALVDLDKLKENSSEALEDLHLIYDIPKHAKIIGTASYIYPPKFLKRNGLKGHDVLLKVFSKILEKHDDIYLVIAGGTFGKNRNYELKLKKLANKISDKKIIFTGSYNNVFSVIGNFDVFLYLSRSENLGGVYESLFYGIPTISSDRGALPELVENNSTGFNCSLDDIDEIVKKTFFLLENPEIRLNFKENGKKLVMELFDKNKIIDEAYIIYKSLISS